MPLYMPISFFSRTSRKVSFNLQRQFNEKKYVFMFTREAPETQGRRL